MLSEKIAIFSKAISGYSLTEVDIAVALIWFISHEDHAIEISAKDVAEIIIDQRIKSSINVSRLSLNLSKHGDLVKGKSRNSYKIRASSEKKLSDLYREYRRAENIRVGEHVLSFSVSLGGRAHLEAIRREVNGCYEIGCYNSCAVMCRRLVELLLIEAYDNAGKLDDVRDSSGNIQIFSELISRAKSGKLIKLSRNLPSLLDRVKATGDGAAHSRFYTATKRDIDDMNPALRHAVAELAALGGL